MTTKAHEWRGPEDGLPPVGMVCEVNYCEAWHDCEVIAHFQQRAGMVAASTVETRDGIKRLDGFRADCFRPIISQPAIDEPKGWSGEGLPPKRTECEWRANGGEWKRGFIIE